jgi:hypothetical protein
MRTHLRERREMLTANRIFVVAKSQTKARGQCGTLPLQSLWTCLARKIGEKCCQ